MCTGIRTGDIVHYEDTERGRESLRKTAALRQRQDELDKAAYAVDSAYTGTLAFVSSQEIHQSANQRQILYIHQLGHGKLMSALQPGLSLACMSCLSIS